MKGNARHLDDGIEMNRYTLGSFRYWISVPVLQDSEMENVQVLQDSETEKCLQVRCHWKVKMIRAGYLTLVSFAT
ncbi:hypothetical protein RIR_jg33016.t1 [Rhizophagus irregularis DAOM 181602=DAOM 197198]|nr:hypothetical protein RIR_jg33016.t1 [Rhizophagus irregularis DAOM 181602=DAOM 197198]